MHTRGIFTFCTSCAIFFMVNSSPIDVSTTKTETAYQLVPLKIDLDKTPYNSQNIQRDIYSDDEKIQRKASSIEVKTEHNFILEPTKKEDSKRVLMGEKKEILKTAADRIHPAIYRVRRAYENRRRYDDSDNYYDDSSYAGYDRKGAAVGYMDANDDFPTVVW